MSKADPLVLITGGAGFIGSHTAVALAQAGVPSVLLDDFSNARPDVLERMARGEAEHDEIDTLLDVAEGDVHHIVLLLPLPRPLVAQSEVLVGAHPVEVLLPEGLGGLQVGCPRPDEGLAGLRQLRVSPFEDFAVRWRQHPGDSFGCRRRRHHGPGHRVERGVRVNGGNSEAHITILLLRG